MFDFTEIYTEYKNKIQKFAYNYTKDVHEQEELVQDIFYNIFIALKNFKSKSGLKTYIYAIARNRCSEFIKNKVKERNKIDKAIKFYENIFEVPVCEKFILSEDVRYFLSVLERIPFEYREVFYLSEVENMKYKEIGDILKIPVGTVKSRINRAKEKIAGILKNESGGV